MPKLESFDIGIVGGAGHVGLPLALMFAVNGKKTLVQDINARALEVIRSGRMPHMELDADDHLERALASGNLHFSTDVTPLSATDTIVITIGTPVDEFLNPVQRSIRECVDGLMTHIRDDQLIVLRSTVFPGTTDWLDRYLKAHGKSPLVAFCPERVVQGFSFRELANMPQIVSGTTPEAASRAADLFSIFATKTIEVSPLEAEFAKLFTNAYRYIEFAAANQLYMIADSAGVDFQRIHKAMTESYPRMKGFPKAGFAAGPCLLKDTMQLAAFANNQFSLGHNAMMVNEGLALYVVEKLKTGFDLARTNVGLLGAAFKAEIDDIRSSLSYKLKKMLEMQAKSVLMSDPFVTEDPTLVPVDELLGKSDVLVICTPHSAYKALDLSKYRVIDVWGIVDQTAAAS
jgi:UDP-N-acetyl-D-mannosaminuronic acid dehydrogenase